MVLSTMTLALASVLILWALYALFWPFEPLRVSEGNLALVNARVPRGETLYAWMSYCKPKPYQARVETMIEHAEGSLYLLRTQYPPPTSGCNKVKVPLARIPANLPIESTTAVGSGHARIVVSYHFELNALRTMSYTYRTAWFTIEP
jgi:hypothetical protein